MQSKPIDIDLEIKYISRHNLGKIIIALTVGGGVLNILYSDDEW